MVFGLGGGEFRESRGGEGTAGGMLLTRELEEEFVVGPIEGASEIKCCGGRYRSMVVMEEGITRGNESLWC